MSINYKYSYRYMINQNQDKPKTQSSVRSSQIFYTFTDDDMAEFFIELIQQQKQQLEQETHGSPKQKEEVYQQIKIQQEEKMKPDIDSKKQYEGYSHTTRLEIQIQKNRLEFVPVFGEIFIKLIEADLHNDKKIERGMILLTNYRLAFFKKSSKKIDLPFGFIDNVNINKKSLEMSVFLKHGHSWKFRVDKLSSIEEINVFLNVYMKTPDIRSNFAFSYFQKCPHEQASLKLSPRIDQQFFKMVESKKDKVERIINKEYEICSSYPQTICVPTGFVNKCKKLSHFWTNDRLPILSFSYSSHMHDGSLIWRSSSMNCDRNMDLTEVGRYFHALRGNNHTLAIFECSPKTMKKGLDQLQIYPHCSFKNLELESISSIKTCYLAAIECFLHPRKSFIKDLLASKWYDGVLNALSGACSVSSTALNGKNIIIRCIDGRDRSCEISALSQLILCPFYRTFKGFPILVEKQFQNFGYPFTSKFGFKSQKDEISPLFIQFLDSVSQLINSNPLSFEFNYKFLSKLSNLMYTCLFGTFIGETPQQRQEYHVVDETMPIWGQLRSELTENPFYQQKQGTLSIPHSYNDIRVWKEHFWYLTTPPKQSYKIDPIAEDNYDYKNLACLKIKYDNSLLREQITAQRNKIQNLKQALEGKKQKK